MKIVTDNIEYTENGKVTTANIKCHLDIIKDPRLIKYFNIYDVTVTATGTATCSEQDIYDAKVGRSIARTKAFYKAYRHIRNIVESKVAELFVDLSYINEVIPEQIYERMDQQAEEYRKLTNMTENEQFDYESKHCMWID